MANLVLLVASSALGNSDNSTYSHAGLYNGHNSEVLTPAGYPTVKLCKAADPSGNCTLGSISFSCSCDVREFVDEVNARRCAIAPHPTPDAPSPPPGSTRRDGQHCLSSRGKKARLQ